MFEVAIEGVDGTYSFNPLHFHLMPSGEVATWRSDPIGGIKDRPDAPTPIDELDPISFGSISAGDRLSGTLVFDQPEAALDNAAIVLRSLLLPGGGAAAFWPVA